MSEKIPTNEIQETTLSHEEQGYNCELGNDYPLYEVGQLEFVTDTGNVYKIDRRTIFNTRTGETTNFSDEDQRVGKLVI